MIGLRNEMRMDNGKEINMSKKSKYTTTEEILAENEAREIAAYNAVKGYITNRQNRFIGACGYSINRIKAQCAVYHNHYLNDTRTNVRKYLTIPT